MHGVGPRQHSSIPFASECRRLRVVAIGCDRLPPLPSPGLALVMWALLLTVLLSAAVKGRRLADRTEFDLISKSWYRRAVVAWLATPIISAVGDGKSLTGAVRGS